VLARDGACPPVGGNRVVFITSGEQAYTQLTGRIEAAVHSIHLMTFILGRDPVGRKIVDALARKARQGVKVRLLLDALGCFTTSGRFCDPIRRAGGEVVKFMPVLPLQTRGSANLRNHRKIAVFDNRLAAIGGRNLAKEYMGPRPLKKRWRDFGASIEGPAVCLLNDIFLADWAFATGQSPDDLRRDAPPATETLAGPSDLQVVASGPDVAGDPLYEGILSLVESAKQSIWIVTPYFIPDEVLFRLLVVKARSGLDVRLVVPARSNHPITDLAGRYALRELQAAGTRVLLYNAGMNHAKLILIDEAVGMWGSANLDLRSLFVNFEAGVITYTHADAQAIAGYIRETFALSSPMPEPDGRRRVFRTIGEEVSRLLAPLL
jgi:cardiolipin synthase A/B